MSASLENRRHPAARTRDALISPPSLAPRRDPSLVPFLSIQLLVLAFFIILTSHARLDGDKSRDVTESVQRHFAGPQEEVAPGPESGVLSPDAATVLRNALLKFQGLVPLDGKVREISAHEVAIRLPIALFFTADAVTLRDSRQALIDEVMAALAQRPVGWAYELELLVQGDPPSASTLDRAANLAAALAQAGRTESGVVVAAGRGDPAWMVLLIRLRPGQGASDSAQPAVTP